MTGLGEFEGLVRGTSHMLVLLLISIRNYIRKVKCLEGFDNGVWKLAGVTVRLSVVVVV